MIISYKKLTNTLNLEALKNAPDGNVLTGYQVINYTKVLVDKSPAYEIYAIPKSESNLTIDVEIHKNGKRSIYRNVLHDLDTDLIQEL